MVKKLILLSCAFLSISILHTSSKQKNSTQSSQRLNSSKKSKKSTLYTPQPIYNRLRGQSAYK